MHSRQRPLKPLQSKSCVCSSSTTSSSLASASMRMHEVRVNTMIQTQVPCSSPSFLKGSDHAASQSPSHTIANGLACISLSPTVRLAMLRLCIYIYIHIFKYILYLFDLIYIGNASATSNSKSSQEAPISILAPQGVNMLLFSACSPMCTSCTR